MLAILLVSLCLLALLAVYLKKRHRRKIDVQLAIASGFPVVSDRNGATSADIVGRDMWGPHQHMEHTRGWEYSHDQDAAVAAGGIFAGREEKGKSTRSRRDSVDGKGNASEAVTEKDMESALAASSPGVVAGRTRSQRKRERDAEREKSRDIERRLRGVKDKDIDRDRGKG